MTEPSDLTPIFTAYYAGRNKFPYAPIKTNIHENRYTGFFISSIGEKWVFVYDADLGGGILLGNDCDWEIIPLGNANAPLASHVTLGEDETLWLRSCWLASAHLREPDGGEDVPWDALTLGLASITWGISGNILKEQADDGKLIAKKLGNIWITTMSAMTKAFGVPKKDQAISREIGEEVDRLSKKDVEEIRLKLMKE